MAVGQKVEHGVGQKFRADPLPLAEIGGHLQVGVTHVSPAIHCPANAAATPSTTLITTLAAAGPNCRSSASRWVSSIQVENVVRRRQRLCR